MRHWIGAVAVVGMLCLVSAEEASPQNAVLTGVVVSNVTDEPLPGALISLVGRDIEVVADEEGRFSIDGLSTGMTRARFEAEGYVSVVVDLDAAVEAFLRIRLSPVAAVLDEIRIMTGRPSTRENASTLSIGRDEEGWRSVLDLLADQVPGVVVRRSGGNLGSGAYLYLRAAGSLNGDLAPDVYLDGTRIDGRNTGSRSLHVLDLISAEEVASVRVYKGASGGAGFALGGANGAIVIETRR